MIPQLRVKVIDHEIVVTVPGFRYSATYCKSYDARHLVARNIPITDDLRITMKKSEFLVAAKKRPATRRESSGGSFSARFGGRPLPLDKH